MRRVYIAASTQRENVGVGVYGTEEENMQILADRVAEILKSQGDFEVFRNKHGWSLEQTVNDCNNLACEIFIDNHSNAGGWNASGTEVYYYSANGKVLAGNLYTYIAPLSKGSYNGVRPDTTLYKNGLYVLRNTKPIAALVEHFYHTDIDEVNYFLTHVDEYAIGEVKGICQYFGVQYKDVATDKYKKAIEQIKSIIEGL